MLPRVGAIPRALALPALLLALVGCGPEPDPWPSGTSTPTPEATPTALWSDDDEALELAVAAYQKYLDVAAEIAADGGRDPERIEPYVTSEQYENELAGFSRMRDSRVTQRGESLLFRPSAQTVRVDSVTFSVCWDRSALRQFDDDGNDVTRPEAQMITANLVETTMERGVLVMKGARSWDDSYCS
jgi:hypothetical protein